MSLSHRNLKAEVRKIFLVSACVMFGTGVLFAGNRPDSDPEETEAANEMLPQTPPPRTLRPVDTGRSVTFHIGSSNSYDRFAVKTNLAYWGALTPNLGVEIGLTPKLSLEISGGYSPWERYEQTLADGTENTNYKKFIHWVVKPEVRYWLGDRFDRHFFGLQLFYSDYDIAKVDVPILFEKEYYYDGNAYGAGLVYGYDWRWNDRWAMEFSLGVGVIQMEYDRKESSAGEITRFKKTYLGPTSLGVKLLFMIK